MRDIKLRSRLSKNICLSRVFKEKCLCKFFFGSVQIISRLDSRCLHYFLAAILEDSGDLPTWQLHTRLYNFAWNILAHISTSGQLSSLFIILT